MMLLKTNMQFRLSNSQRYLVNANHDTNYIALTLLTLLTIATLTAYLLFLILKYNIEKLSMRCIATWRPPDVVPVVFDFHYDA